MALASYRPLGTYVPPVIIDPDPEPGEGDSNISISVAKTSALVAPATVWLQADVTDFGVSVVPFGYDPSAHEVEYLWSVTLDGDAGYATEEYTAPVHTVDEHKVKGTRYGKRIAHCLERPGTYRFNVTAINLATGDSVGTGTSNEYVVTIADTDDFFSADETFIVDSTNTITGRPATNNAIYTTPNLAISAVNASSVTKARICVYANGTQYTTSELASTRSGLTTIVVDTYGGGAQPEFLGNTVRVVRGESVGLESYAWNGVTVRGTYDIALDNDVGDRGVWIVDATESRGLEPAVTFWNVKAVGVGVFTYGQNNDSVWAMYANCDCGPMRRNALFGTFGKALTVLGSRFAHDPDQVADEGNLTGYFIRVRTNEWLTSFNQNDFFGRCGWFPNAPSIGPTQAIFRLDDADNTYVHIERNTLEGVMRGGFNFSSTSDMNTIVERNLMLGNRDASAFYSSDSAGITFRLNMCVRSPARASARVFNSQFHTEQFLNVRIDGTPSANSNVRPIRCYNNTLIFLLDDTAPAAMAVNAFYTGLKVEANNIRHAPYATSGSVDAGPFTLTGVFTPRDLGYFDVLDGKDPEYMIRVMAPSSGVLQYPQVGEVLTGQTSGAVRTVLAIDTTPTSPVGTNPGEYWISLEHEAEVGPATNVFTGWWGGGVELITGDLGARFNNNTGDRRGSDFRYDTLLMPDTVMPTHVLAFDGQTGAFTEGETLTGPSGSAYICQVHDNGTTGRLWLRDLTGTFTDNQAITDPEGGAALANGAVAISGCGAIWELTTPVAQDRSNWSAAPFARTDFFGNAHTDTGAVA